MAVQGPANRRLCFYREVAEGIVLNSVQKSVQRANEDRIGIFLVVYSSFQVLSKSLQ